MTSIIAAVDVTRIPLVTAIVAYCHYAAVTLVGSIIIYQRSKLQGSYVSEREEQDLGRSDLVLFVSAGLLFVSGYYRTIEYGQGWDFYSHDILFWFKLASAGTLSGLSTFASILRLRRNIPRANGEEIPPMSEALLDKLRLISTVEILVMVSIPLASTLMSRGVLYESYFEWRLGAAFAMASFLGSTVYFGKEAFAWRESWELYRSERFNDGSGAMTSGSRTEPMISSYGATWDQTVTGTAPSVQHARPVPTPSPQVFLDPLSSKPRDQSPLEEATSAATSGSGETLNIPASVPWGVVETERFSSPELPSISPSEVATTQSFSANQPSGRTDSPWSLATKELLSGGGAGDTFTTSVTDASPRNPSDAPDARILSTRVVPRPPKEEPPPSALTDTREGLFFAREVSVIEQKSLDKIRPSTTTYKNGSMLAKDRDNRRSSQIYPSLPPMATAPKQEPARSTETSRLADTFSSMNSLSNNEVSKLTWSTQVGSARVEQQGGDRSPSPRTTPVDSLPTRRIDMIPSEIIETSVDGPPPPPRMFIKTRATPPPTRSPTTPVDGFPERRDDMMPSLNGGERSSTSSPMNPSRMFQKTRAQSMGWRDPPAPPLSAIEGGVSPSSAPMTPEKNVEYTEGERVSTPYGEGVILEVRKDIGMLVVEVGEGRTTAFLGKEAVEKL